MTMSVRVRQTESEILEEFGSFDVILRSGERLLCTLLSADRYSLLVQTRNDMRLIYKHAIDSVVLTETTAKVVS